ANASADVLHAGAVKLHDPTGPRESLSANRHLCREYSAVEFECVLTNAVRTRHSPIALVALLTHEDDCCTRGLGARPFCRGSECASRARKQATVVRRGRRAGMH